MRDKFVSTPPLHQNFNLLSTVALNSINMVCLSHTVLYFPLLFLAKEKCDIFNNIFKHTGSSPAEGRTL